MTLLETLVALVILGLSGVGFLETFQATSRSARDAEAWVSAVGAAEAAMEETKLGAPAHEGTRVQVRPWPEAPGLDVVTVTVTLPDGGEFVVQRLVRAR